MFLFGTWAQNLLAAPPLDAYQQYAVDRLNALEKGSMAAPDYATTSSTKISEGPALLAADDILVGGWTGDQKRIDLGIARLKVIVTLEGPLSGDWFFAIYPLTYCVDALTKDGDMDPILRNQIGEFIAHRLGPAEGNDLMNRSLLRACGFANAIKLWPDSAAVDAKQFNFSADHVFAEGTRWIPPDGLHQEALAAIPRFAFQKWDAPDTAWASQYIGHHFSIGVSGSSQGAEDKPFALNLAGPAGAKTVMVNFFMDGRGDPYGKNKVPTGASGHKKAHHLSPFFGAVQSGSEVLFLASWSPQGPLASKKDPVPVCLQSHLDIPAEAVVWTQDKPTDASQASQSLPGNICFLRMGDVAVGVHFVLATDTSGQPVTAQVFNDGLAYEARRLSVVHSSAPPGQGQGTVAVFIRVQEGLDDTGFTTFRRDFIASKTSAASENGIVCIKAEGLKGALALETDLTKGIVLHTEGANQAMQSLPMSVNGKEYSHGFLRQNADVGF